MNYSGIIKNDFSAAPGISVTLFVSGCDFHCHGCHNPEAQNYQYGNEYTNNTTNEIIEAIGKNNINRNFCVMGGEPLSPPNRETVFHIIKKIKNNFPNIKIYLWTGYIYENISKEVDLSNIDYLIDGPFIQEQRDVTLHMRGSRNQRVIDVKETLKQNKIILSSEVIK